MNTTDAIDAVYEEAGSALAVVESPQSGIMPTVSPDEARSQMRAYQELCAAVLTDDDYQEFTEKKKVNGRYESVTKRFKKKSAVKKLQTYFGISVDVIDEATHRDDLGDGHFGFRTKARATSPGGRHVEAMAGCATHEERFDVAQYSDESEMAYAKRQKKALARAYHDVLSTAETRATNRAVMNLVSPGEVTAEELSRPPRDDQGGRRAQSAPPSPANATDEQHQELQALAKSLGLKIVPWVTANVVPGFDKRDSKTLNVAEYALVRAELEKLIPVRSLGENSADVSDAQSANEGGQPDQHMSREVEKASVPRMKPSTQGILFGLLDSRLSTGAAARHIFAADNGITLPEKDGRPTYSGMSEQDARHLIDRLRAMPDPNEALAEYAESKL